MKSAELKELRKQLKELAGQISSAIGADVPNLSNPYQLGLQLALLDDLNSAIHKLHLFWSAAVLEERKETTT